jgi:hypothetical protein
MPPLPEAIILVLAPFAPRFSTRVWGHAPRLLLGAILAPGSRTVTAALRAMGLAAERRFTHDHRVLNRAPWLGRQASRMLLGLLSTGLREPPLSWEPTTPWNAAAGGRARRKAAIARRCGPPKSLCSAAAG